MKLESLDLHADSDVDWWFAAGRTAIDEIESVVAAYVSKHGGVDPTAVIHPSAVLGPNVYVGEEVSIGPHCYIKDHVVLMRGCQLGFGVELDRCVLFEKVKVAHHACIGRSIVGRESNLAYGFVVATKNLRSHPVTSKLGSAVFVSARRHHGALIGERLITGVNVSVMPGATILSGVTIGPNREVSGVVAENALLL